MIAARRSPMLESLKKNPDGSLTLYIQKNLPGDDNESNWLPAPDGPAYVVMRLDWPKEGSPSIYTALGSRRPYCGRNEKNSRAMGPVRSRPTVCPAKGCNRQP